MWKGIAIYVVVTVFAMILPRGGDVIAAAPTVSSSKLEFANVAKQDAFDPRTDCRVPYKSTVVAELCIADRSAGSSFWSGLFSIMGLVITALIAWKSYEAAQTSAKAADRALSGDRAWMVPATPMVEYDHFYFNPDGPDYHDLIRVSIDVENRGQTPGLKVMILSDYAFAECRDSPPIFPGNQKAARYLTCAPGDKLTTNVWLDGVDGGRAKKSEEKCFVLLDVRYLDVHGTGKERVFRTIFELVNEQFGPESYLFFTKSDGDAEIT